jgi:hypothetical protein
LPEENVGDRPVLVDTLVVGGPQGLIAGYQSFAVGVSLNVVSKFGIDEYIFLVAP